MRAESNNPTLEDLIDELARVLHDLDAARELVRRAGFPPADLPASGTPKVFWSVVLRATADGKILGGVKAIVERAREAFPGNPFLAVYESYTELTSEPTTTRLGSAIDNLGARPPVFEGRDDELEQIRQALVGGSTAVVFAAVVGLGGMGKSRLALEYAFIGDYDIRWWIRAGSVASLQEDLVRLGQRLGILDRVDDVERAVDDVLDGLSTHERWLLVLDNAEGPDELRKALRGHLRNLSSGHVLITSRAQAWRSMAVAIEITTLSPAAARAVLLERSGRAYDGCTDAVAEKLGCLPLALVQAGAYMDATGCSFREYFERLTRYDLAIFRDRKAAAGDYDHTVATTWEVSLAAIREESPAAAALLDWLAFLDPDGVPIRLLRMHPNGLPAQVAACFESELGLDDAVAVLRRYSMVNRVEQPEAALRTHRLVQAVTREKLGDEQRQLAAAAVRWIRAVFAYTPGTTPVGQVPEGIGEQLMAAGTLKECVAASGHDLTWALSGLCYFRTLQGMLSAARAASGRAIDIAEGLAKAAPHDARVQRDFSVALNSLGDVEVLTGGHDAARNLFQRSLEAVESVANVDPQDAEVQRNMAVTLDKLANVEVETGNLAVARNLFQRSLDISEVHAAAYPDIVLVQKDLSLSLGHLGNVEMQAGNFTAARPLFQRSLSILEALPTTEPQDVKDQHNLAVCIEQLAEVEMQARNVTAAREHFLRYRELAEALVKADPQSAQAQRIFSDALDKLGKVELQTDNPVAARKFFQRSLDTRYKLVRTDPNNAQAAFDVATSHQWLAHVAEAEGDRISQVIHLREAKAILDAIDARGQYRSYILQEKAHRYINSRLR